MENPLQLLLYGIKWWPTELMGLCGRQRRLSRAVEGGVGGHWMGLEKCAHCAVYKSMRGRGSTPMSTHASHPSGYAILCPSWGWCPNMDWHLQRANDGLSQFRNTIKRNVQILLSTTLLDPRISERSFHIGLLNIVFGGILCRSPWVDLVPCLVLGQVLYCISEDEWWPYHHWDRLVNWALTARKTKETLRICCYRHLTRVFNIGK